MECTVSIFREQVRQVGNVADYIGKSVRERILGMDMIRAGHNRKDRNLDRPIGTIRPERAIISGHYC
jgi:hypothetical protein